MELGKDKFKIIIGSKVEGCFGGKGVDQPKIFNSINKVKEYYKKRKKEIQDEGESVWFARVWEFGKEDYHCLDIELD